MRENTMQSEAGLRVFEMSAEGRSAELKHQVVRMGAMLLGMLLVVGTIPAVRGGSHRDTFVLAGLVSLLILLATRHSVVLLRSTIDSLRIELGADHIRQTRLGTAETTIAREDIARVRESSASGLRVESTTSDRWLEVPIGLEGYEQVRAQLAEWAEISRTTETRGRGYVPYFAVGVSLALVALLLGLSNPWVVVPTAALSLSALLFVRVMQARNPNVDRRTQLGPWMMIYVFVMLLARAAYTILARA